MGRAAAALTGPAAAASSAASASHASGTDAMASVCVRSLLERPADLARILGKVSRACPLRAECTLPTPISTAALRSSGCAPRYAHRNATNVCTLAGGPIASRPLHAGSGSALLPAGGNGALSLDVAHAQINHLWDRCASRCLYSAATPTGAGWVYDSSSACYRPFQYRPSPTEPLLQLRPRRRRAADASVAASAPSPLHVVARVPLGGQHECVARVPAHVIPGMFRVAEQFDHSAFEQPSLGANILRQGVSLPLQQR